MTEIEDERPFSLSDGDCVVFDPDYVDLSAEATGVLAIQWTVERGLWALVGSCDEAGKYSQGWVEVGRSQEPRAKLRPVN